MKNLVVVVLGVLSILNVQGQIQGGSFGKGLTILGKDNSYKLNASMRFQTLFNNDWTVRNDDLGNIADYEGNFLLRRARFKFNGFVINERLQFKIEVGLSNRDVPGANSIEKNNSPGLILDAVAKYNLVENLWVWAGQTKLPGNRQRVLSSANMQFVDRSLLNSRFNIDRGTGLQLRHKIVLGENFIIKEALAFSQGEGRNVTRGAYGGFEYTGRLDFLPMGEFASKGDYSGSDLKREPKPKLALGVTYDINQNTVRERGNLGSFIVDNGTYYGKDMFTFFADAMFKYKGVSFMAEYAERTAEGDDPFVRNENDVIVGSFLTGKSINLQLGYLFKNNIEIAGRFAGVDSDEVLARDQNEYRICVSKYFAGHKLKIQSDIGYIDNQASDDGVSYRFQIDVHF